MDAVGLAAASSPWRHGMEQRQWHPQALKSEHPQIRIGYILPICQSKTEKLTVSITGATGFIGTKLVQRLVSDGHSVRVLTRSKSKASLVFPAREYPRIEIIGDYEWAKGVEGSDGVVNLAGTPISSRWTKEIKDDIKYSRVYVTKKVVQAINAAPKELQPSVLINASAVGYYGTSENIEFDEKGSSGTDYLAEVCREWESAAKQVNTNVRLVLLRTGIVLDKDGGAVAKMVPMFKLFAGGPLGSGNQWCSWIHREDVVSIIVQALTNPAYDGVLNATAPYPVRMGELCNVMGAILGRPSWLPVPELALRLVLAEGASVVLDGQKVVPKRLQDLNFSFKYPVVTAALQDILS